MIHNDPNDLNEFLKGFLTMPKIIIKGIQPALLNKVKRYIHNNKY